jgi:hypothetical protein
VSVVAQLIGWLVALLLAVGSVAGPAAELAGSSPVTDAPQDTIAPTPTSPMLP